MARIYVASSWRNEVQPLAVRYLGNAGFEVYDFRNPSEGDKGFHWSEIDPEWGEWSPEKFMGALDSRVAVNGFQKDWSAMVWADACLMLMPCGRSAHLEAGYFVGAGKPLVIMLSDGEPELMYKMATTLVVDLDSAAKALRRATGGGW